MLRITIAKNFLLQCILIYLQSTNARNTVMILADDAGLQLGVYGNKVIRSPNIDGLAQQGTTFMNAFTSVSSCSPSRSALLTGMPIHENGMYGLHQGVHHFNSFDTIQSLPALLKERNLRIGNTSGGEKKLLTGIIGKKHVGPEYVYPFDYAHTEETESITQVGRNITLIKHYIQEFLTEAKNQSKDFFLYVAFHDPHRCGHTNPEFGNFCEKFGNGDPGMGKIPDWEPQYYSPEEVVVPYFVQDTPAARSDISNQYTTLSRLDQGIGMIIKQLTEYGVINDTLVIYSSDNGIPFPSGRTNLYDSGIKEPLIIVAPNKNNMINTRSRKEDSLVSLLDIMPTILDWHGVPIPANLTGKSLLPYAEGYSSTSKKKNDRKIHKRKRKINKRADLKANKTLSDNNVIFGSHSFHEVTMAYPMRYIRSKRYKLIHNINYQIPFPIDQDFYLSPSFQDILSRTKANQSLNWYKSLQEYYFRPEWELFDLKVDVEEKYNVAQKTSYQTVFDQLKTTLSNWQNRTKDPWICSPHAVLEDKGTFKNNPQCLPLYNEAVDNNIQRAFLRRHSLP